MSDQAKYTNKLHGKRILVIGGSSGIGYAVAEGSLEHGAHITIASSNPDRVAQAVKKLQDAYPSAKDRIVGHACNLNDEATLEDNIIHLLSQLPKDTKLDHVNWTAGEYVPPTPLAEASVSKIRSAMTTRYIAPIILAKHLPPYLTASPDSSITLTTGIVTEKPIPGWSVIAGGRSAVIGLGKALALDMKPVRVNVVCVGAVETPSLDRLQGEAREKMFKALVDKSTTGRVAKPEMVAEAYLYCMRDGNVTGNVVVSSSGVLLT
ncbi:hypothetical protein M409DRAFT_28437 [Zasmidium cellare ATCC 36951]|uniref:Uncharacterized protein n=1 Tax=Zasmidium cellare ATCC 36951 TaxID=1080233 RepID=A0A6A6C201_ZASCE|nr:uncharacterized protein M409DRAFT_28437 [Zasmidium cellare ATCC 36951]KAF2161107.1 hypothetical protein M409DRAFT_28437 [Zasmidium cellare ATCC 36951]